MTSWLRWTLLALLGLAVAAAISVAASNLVSQRIGLASEPLTAGQELAPPPRGDARRSNDRHSRPTTTAPTTTATTTTTAAPPPPSVPTNGPYPGQPTTPAPHNSPPAGGTEHEGGDD